MRQLFCIGARGNGIPKPLLLALAVLSLLGASIGAGHADGAGGWTKLNLREGQTGRYGWDASVLIPPQNSSKKLCTQLSLIEPSKVEGTGLGHESTECAVLEKPAFPVTGSVSGGVGSSRILVLERLYEPPIRSVTVLFGDGSKRDVRLQAVRGGPGGVPRFRYLVLPVRARACVRGLITIAAQGRVVRHEPVRSCST